METINWIISILIICLALSVYIWAVTIRRGESEKRFYFVLIMSAIIVYLAGHMLEMLAVNADSALTAVKVLYLGANFISPFFLLFVIDYCEVNVPKKVVVPALLSTQVITLAMVWTAERHKFMYTSYGYDAEAFYLGLKVTAGTGYYIMQTIFFAHMFLACLIIIRSTLKSGERKRLPPILLLVSAMAPVFANLFSFLFTHVIASPVSGFNFSPYAMVITNVLLYFGVVRHDTLNIVPKAYALSFDLINAAVIFTDAALTCISSNRAADKMFPELKTAGKNTPVTKVPGWPAELTGLRLETGQEDTVFTMPGKEDRFFRSHIDPIISQKGLLGLVILIRDVTEVTLLLNRLRDAAQTDALTGINNRRHFMELAETQMERSKREGTPCSAIMMDIDFFKKCNDTHGHLFGDEVLRTLAAKIKASTRPYEIFGRYGGEEFALFVSSGADVAVQIAERIRLLVVATPIVLGEIRDTVTCSLGVAAREGDESLDELLDRADKALYFAKNNGRNQTALYSAILHEPADE